MGTIMKTKAKDRKSLIFKALILGICLMLSPAAWAQGVLPSSPSPVASSIINTIATTTPPTPAASPCDPKYYDSLKSRAWMEAQREVTQNQNLIYKPDSVLAYTCFDKFLGELAKEAPTMFSGASRWGSAPGNMATTLKNLSLDAMNKYLQGNFDHNSLGGRGAGKYTAATSVTAGAYACDEMRKIWDEAKCIDFMKNPANDGFFPFDTPGTDDYRDGDDRRFLPTACQSATLKQQWGDNIDKATVDASTTWVEDDAITYLNRLDPLNCATTTGPNATFPIETGIIIKRSGTPPEYREKVCLAPGCHYVPTGMTTGTCKP